MIVEGDRAEIERGLVAELFALGFTSERRAIAIAFDRAHLEASAAELDADALVALRDIDGGIEVWIADRVTRKVVVRVVRQGAGDPRTATLQVLEVLRASFLEIESRGFVGEATPVMEAWVAEALTAPPRPAARRRALTARVGAALSLDPGGLPPGAHIDAEIALHLELGAIGAGVHGWAYAPTAPLVALGHEGSAEQTFVLAGLGLHLLPLEIGSAIDLRFGVRGGVMWMQSAGGPSAGYEGRVAELVSAVLGGDVRASWWVIEWLAIDIGASVLVALPVPAVVFAARRVATWGAPVVLLSIGITIGFASL